MRALLVAPGAGVRETVEQVAGESLWELVVAGAAPLTGEQAAFDVVVVDCSISGAPEMVAALRGSEACAAAHILAVGAREGQEFTLLGSGADDVAVEPLDEGKLRTRLAIAAKQAGRRPSAGGDAARDLGTTIADAPGAIFLSQPDGRQIVANEAGRVLTGYTSDELLEMSMSDLIERGDLHRNPLPFAELQEGRIVEGERRVVRKDGSTIAVEATAKLLPNGRLMSIALDMTNRNRSAEVVRASEERLRTVVEASPDMIAIVELDGQLRFANSAHLRLLGRNPYELIGRPATAIVRPDERGIVLAGLRSLAEGGMIDGSRVIHFQHADGHWVPMDVSTRVLADADGTPTGVVVVSRDVSSRVEAEANLRESEQHYRTLVENVLEGVYRVGADGRLLMVNPALIRMLGYDSEEELVAVGEVASLYADPHQRSSIVAEVERAGDLRSVELQLRRKDGAVITVLDSARAVHDKQGELAYLEGTLIDITERKLAEQRLTESEERYRRLVELSPDAIVVHRERRVLYVNAAGLRLVGVSSPDHVLGHGILEFLHPDDRERVLQEILAEAGTGSPALVSGRVLRTDGAALDVELVSAPTVVEGRPATQTILRDVTERKRADKALVESQRTLATLMNNLPGMAYRCLNDEFWTMEFASAGCFELTGYAPEELVGNASVSYEELIVPEDRAMVRRAVDDGLAARRAYVLSYRIRTRLGEEKWVWEQGEGVFSEWGEVVALEGFIADVTERMKAQEQTKESERRFRALVELSPDMVTVHDGEKLLYMNQAGALMLGYERPEELVGTRATDHLDAESVGIFADRQRRLRAGAESVPAQEMKFVRRDGSRIIVEAASVATTFEGRPAVQVVARDVTDRKQAEVARLALERKLLETQKLESLGVLAGGIAHDFNNLLVAIMGNASLAMGAEGEELKEYLTEIQTASQRAADLAKQMLAYSGRGRLVVAQVDLSALVEEMGHLLNVSIAKKASLELVLGREMPLVQADPTQLRQIVMNLVINAAEAIGDNQGVIRVATGLVHATASYLRTARLAQELKEGDYAFVEVADTGIGMDAATRERIFDPFFTTKFTGRGLGLAAVLGIVRGHRGAMTVESEPGKGTTFRLLLPLEGSAATSDAPVAHEPPAWTAEGRTVLVVDDEATVRAIAARMLERMGFRVIEAVDGEEGVASLREHRDEVEVVLLDLMMPRLGGQEAFEQMLALKPNLRVLVMSGYSELEAEGHFGGGKHAGFIQKPFTFADLEAAVRAAVSAG